MTDREYRIGRSTEIEVFRRKARRHWLAIDTLPSARLFEVFPITAIANSVLGALGSGAYVVDLMAGCGYLTRALATVAERVVAIDGTEEMLRHCPDGGNIERRLLGDIRMSPIPCELYGYSMVCCLAGLHHVFFSTPEGRIDPYKSLLLQQEVVLRWASALPPGGAMLLADVPHESIPAEHYEVYASEESLVPLKYQKSPAFSLSPPIAAVWSSVRKGLSKAGSLDEYCEIMREMSSRIIGRPADWFIDVVKSQTVLGHHEYFIDAEGLAQGLRAHGFNVSYRIVPTPWVFDSLRNMAWYFHEKFGFGESIGTPGEMSEAEIEDIVAKIGDTLGIKRGPTVFWVHWNLTFLLIQKEKVQEKVPHKS